MRSNTLLGHYPIFMLLMVVTCGIYWFYVAYEWAKELNGLHGRPKYQPVIILVVNILTCAAAGIIFEILYAFDLEEAAKNRGIADRMDKLGTRVIVCNCGAIVTSLIPGGIVVGMPLGILASVFVQVELNKLADRSLSPARRDDV